MALPTKNTKTIISDYTTEILKIALASKFKDENIDALLEVINATKNPDIATSILLDIYIKPELSSTAKDLNSQVNRTLSSVNYIDDEVSYTYNSRKYNEGYCLKSIENPLKEDLCKQYYKSECAEFLKLTDKEFDELYHKVIVYGEIEITQKRTDTCSISAWIKESNMVCNN